MQEIKNENVAAGPAGVNVGADSGRLTIAVVRFIALLSVAIFAPAIDVQAVTGTLVNATLFVATVLIGVPAALLIGIIPSAISSVTGLLPAAILPMVPFIIFSNAILILVFAALRKGSYWRAVAAASLFKFAFLSAVGTYVIGYFVSDKVVAKVAAMMSYPQLLTALTGGAVAYLVLGVLGKNANKE